METLFSAEVQATVLQVLAVLTVVLPLLEKLAAKTSNKIDDEAVSVLGKILALVPRVRLGDPK
jgi:hypothetical protein